MIIVEFNPRSDRMKTLKILETMWFIIAAVSLATGIFKLITESLTESTGFLIIALLAFAFGFSRRKQRLRSERHIDEVIEHLN